MILNRHDIYSLTNQKNLCKKRQRKENRKKKKKKEDRTGTDFIPELIGKPVAIEIDGEIDGKDESYIVIIDNSIFWIKFQDANGNI